MPKKKKTKTDQPPEREKQSTIQCRYCPRSFSRRNCYRIHLVTHKHILYAEKNDLEELISENNTLTDQLTAKQNQSQTPLSKPNTQPTATTSKNPPKRTPLTPIFLNELGTAYKEQLIEEVTLIVNVI